MGNTILGAGDPTTGYDVTNSCLFDGTNDNFNITHSGSATGARRTMTLSCWVKLGILGSVSSTHCNFLNGYVDDNNYSGFGIRDDDRLEAFGRDSGSTSFQVQSNATLRDRSAWYHVVFAVDTTQGTDTNRVKIYLNGVQQGIASSPTWPDQNLQLDFHSGHESYIGRQSSGGGFFDGYMAEVVFIDGQQLDASYFGETGTDGSWIPKDISAQGFTFGNDGYYLQFKQTGTSANSSGKGADTSGNDNHWEDNNFAGTFNITQDTPTNNFAVLTNHGYPQNSRVTLTQGNLDFDFTGDGGQGGRRLDNHVISNIGVTTGKWYMEAKLTEDLNAAFIGVSNYSNKQNTAEIESYNYVITNAGNKYVREHTGESESNAAHGGGSNSLNDIWQVALDATNRNVYFGKNGSWADGSGSWDQSSPTSAVAYTADFVTTDSHGVVVFNLAGAGSSETPRWLANFGNPIHSISSGNADANGYGNFEFAVPSGYYALCTKNLAKYG